MTTHLDIERERREFEAVVAERFQMWPKPFERFGNDYSSTHVENQWQGWLAARRASLQADERKERP